MSIFLLWFELLAHEYSIICICVVTSSFSDLLHRHLYQLTTRTKYSACELVDNRVTENSW